MGLMAVNSINFKNNNVAFTSRGDKENDSYQSLSNSGSNNLAKIPLVVLMSMSPSLLNSETIEQYYPLEEDPTTEISTIPNNEFEVQMVQQGVQGRKVDLAKAFGRNKYDIQYSKEFQMNGKTYALVYTKFPAVKNPNAVNGVFIVPEGFKDRTRPNEIFMKDHPPRISKVVFHTKSPNDPEGSVGVVLVENKYNSSGDQIGYSKREIFLPDEAGEPIYLMLENQTKWEIKGLTLEYKPSMDLEPYEYYKHK